VSEWLGDLGAKWRRDRDRVRARRRAFNEAVASVRGMSAPKSRDEVRELLAAELRARDVTPPGEPGLGHLVDRVLADGDLLTQLHLAGRGLGLLAGVGGQFTRDIRDLFQGTGLNLDLGNASPLFIDCDPSKLGAQVILDLDAQQLLDPRGDRESGPSPDFSEIFVLLTWAAPGRDSGQVAVRAGDHRVGVLAAADSAAFRAFLDQGSKLDRPVVTEAFRDRAPDNSWRLTVYQPSTCIRS
jgi:hypothetical protein